MGTEAPTSSDVAVEEKENDSAHVLSPVELDVEALFVLQSQGSWLHCGYHLTTSIVGPALLSLPFSLNELGWIGRIMCLIFCTSIIFYSYNHLFLVLEHHITLGHRLLRFRDMATHILGPKWGKYFVGPMQLGVCYGAVVFGILLGGQNLKYIYLLSNSDGTMKLYQFIIIFGALILILAQVPSFHSLRHINLLSLTLSLAYSACVTAASLHLGRGNKARLFQECTFKKLLYLQATIAAPVKGKMLKGLCVCYTVLTLTFFSVAISGYWAFGNEAMGTILANSMGPNKPILPSWFLTMANAFCLLQVSAVKSVYLQPTNEVFKKKFANPNKTQFSTDNVVPRLISRSLSVIIATIFAAMFPFFGDLMALFGAFGCIPIDFIMPMIFYNVTFKPSKGGLVFLVGNFFSASGNWGRCFR